MEKSLPATVLYSPDSQHQPVLEQDVKITEGYDTQLIPHISLPQRHQTANAEKRPGLLGFAFQQPMETSKDSGLTMELNKQEIAQSIIMNEQIQGAPTLASISATFANTSKHPYMQSQTTQRLQASIVPEYTGQLIMNSPNKRHSYEEREIACLRTQILIKAIMTLILFVSIGGVIWIFFSHTAIYLLILFIILAILLGTILSKLIGDYYQFNLHGVQPMSHLHISGNTHAPQVAYESYPHIKGNTSEYLHTLVPFHKEKTIDTTD